MRSSVLKHSGKRRIRRKTSMPAAHVALSLVVIVGVFFLVYADRLQGQAAATLIGGIVFSIFGRGSR